MTGEKEEGRVCVFLMWCGTVSGEIRIEREVSSKFVWIEVFLEVEAGFVVYDG